MQRGVQMQGLDRDSDVLPAPRLAGVPGGGGPPPLSSLQQALLLARAAQVKKACAAPPAPHPPPHPLSGSRFLRTRQGRGASC